MAAFTPNRSLRLSEILSLSIMSSDNPCADYLLDLAGKPKVNQRASNLGLLGTQVIAGFRDEQLSRHGGSVTTAWDMATLLAHLHCKRNSSGYDILWKAMRNNLRQNRIPSLLPDCFPVAHKTGSLQSIAHDAAILEFGPTTVILVVLTENEATTVQTNLDIGRYARSVYDCLVTT
jgi:beta-lactamase class A